MFGFSAGMFMITSTETLKFEVENSSNETWLMFLLCSKLNQEEIGEQKAKEVLENKLK